MIKYKNKIIIQRKRNGDLQIVSDRGDQYETFPYENSRTLITSWWKDQNQSDLREWQKDLVVRYAGDALGKGAVFNIYKRGQGYSQNHDMCLFYVEAHNCWIFATQDDYWIQFSDGGEITFNKADSLGSVLKKEDRLVIGNIWDQLKKEFNPNNLSQWIKG